MYTLPEKIENALQRIKKEHSHYVDVKIINGRCYVYESTSKWDKELKKIQKITKYIGRITEEGEFIASNPRNPTLSGAAIENIPKKKSNRYRMGLATASRREESVVSVGPLELNETDRKLLIALSMNARASLSEIGKQIGLTPTATYYRVKNLDEKYGIKYTLEINLEKLRYMQFILFVKFSGNIPMINDVRKVMEEEPSVQFAMATKGDYDIVAYLVEEDTYTAERTLWKLRQDPRLKGFDSAWNLVPLFRTYGVIRLRDTFFDNVLKKRVWTRSKDALVPKQNSLMQREFVALKALNNDSKGEFASIDSANGLNRGASQYTYHKLKDSGIITRSTIAIDSMPMKYTGLIIVEYVNINDFNKTRPTLLSEVIKDRQVANKYDLVGDIESPSGIIFFLPVISGEELSSTEEELKATIKGVKISTVVATDMLVGNLCHRKFDVARSGQSEILVKAKDIEYGTKVDYG